MASEKKTEASKFTETIYQSTRKGEIKFGIPKVFKGKEGTDKTHTTRWISKVLKSKATVQFDVIKREGKSPTGKPRNPRYIISVIDAKKQSHSFSGKYARALETFLTKGESKKRSVEMSKKQKDMVSGALKGL